MPENQKMLMTVIDSLLSKKYLQYCRFEPQKI